MLSGFPMPACQHPCSPGLLLPPIASLAPPKIETEGKRAHAQVRPAMIRFAGTARFYTKARHGPSGSAKVKGFCALRAGRIACRQVGALQHSGAEEPSAHLRALRLRQRSQPGAARLSLCKSRRHGMAQARLTPHAGCCTASVLLQHARADAKNMLRDFANCRPIHFGIRVRIALWLYPQNPIGPAKGASRARNAGHWRPPPAGHH